MIKQTKLINIVSAVILLIYIFLQVYFLSISRNAILIWVSLNSILLIAISLIITKIDFVLLLFIFSHVSYLIHNNVYHYYLPYIVLLDFPLFLLFFLYVIRYLGNYSPGQLKLTYLQKPALFLLLYTMLAAVIGKLGGNSTYRVVDETYHILYYAFIFVFPWIIKDQERFFKNYLTYFIILFTLIGAQYLIFNLQGQIRFVTFQSGLLPVAIGLLFSYLLFSDRTFLKKTLAVLALSIMLAGMVLTLTRGLWITSAVIIFIILFFYLKKKNKLKYFTVSIISFVVLFLVSSDNSSPTGSDQLKDIDKIEYRVTSIKNASQDMSLLMRVELGYYIFQKFITSPFFGTGLGDSVSYKITSLSNEPVYYPDGTFVYFIWKGGIIGLSLFLWLFYRGLRASYLLYSKYGSFYYLAIFAGLIGLLILSLTTPILIKYRATIVAVFLLSYIDIEYSRFIKNSQTKQLNESTLYNR